MRSSSLITTILTETTHHNECPMELTKENEETKDERRSLTTSNDQFVFSTSKSNPKTSFWTVIDRQAEWYKLTIPVQQQTTNSSTTNKNLSVTCRTLEKTWQRKKSNSNINENNEKIT